MKPIYSSGQVREMDRLLIDSLGMPSHSLMETAGKAAAEILVKRHPLGSFGVFCGSGNNGGDGYVIARWLHLWGRKVYLWAAAAPKSDDARLNARLCEAAGVQYGDDKDLAECDIGVDALLGTGQSRAPAGRYLDGLVFLDRIQTAGGQICAIDIPTGLDPELGSPLGDAFIEAEHTITFGFPKLALYNSTYAGDVDLVDIGFALTAERIRQPNPPACMVDYESLEPHLPKNREGDAKWDRGHVAILGGGGAAVLASHGALSAGAGLVSVLAPRSEWPRMKGMRPEIILGEETSLETGRYDAIVLGPGLGLTREKLVLRVWKEIPCTVVADADALTILAKAEFDRSGGTRIITPHAAEAARLLNRSRSEIEADPFSAVRDLQKFGFAILKGPYTRIGHDPIWINPRGGSQLATAGSGDVIAGMIAALSSRKIQPRIACSIAALWHLEASDHLGPGRGATDLLDSVGNLARKYFR
jgi:ADP-dependent NAD(P)H-hydrate dehydratase / NAD(P)H-hydrate epimerase